MRLARGYLSTKRRDKIYGAILTLKKCRPSTMGPCTFLGRPIKIHASRIRVSKFDVLNCWSFSNHFTFHFKLGEFQINKNRLLLTEGSIFATYTQVLVFKFKLQDTGWISTLLLRVQLMFNKVQKCLRVQNNLYNNKTEKNINLFSKSNFVRIINAAVDIKE